MWGDEVDSISTIDPLLGEVITKLPSVFRSFLALTIDARQYHQAAINTIKEELDWWSPAF